jgi:RimJ/RimL family protein N-acetyltransferase
MQIKQTVLSPFGSESDMVPLFFKWLNTPEVYRFMGDIDQFPFIVDDAKSYYLSHKKDTWLVCVKIGEELIPVGYTGIFIRKRHSVGIFRVAIPEKEFQGKGHAKRATQMILKWGFEECDLRNIHLSVSSANEGAIALYKKVGFKECGKYKSSRYENGEIHDEILMQFLKEDWKKI